MPEFWDAYYENGEPAGVDLIRGEPIPDGLFHLVSEIVVRHRDGSFLVMQRDFNKPICPGMLEITAGGSALKGETALEAAIRELYEETGIKAASLKFEYSEVNTEKKSIFNMFSVITDCNKKSVRLQEGETVKYEWIAKNELIKRIEENPQNYVDVKRIYKCSLFKM